MSTPEWKVFKKKHTGSNALSHSDGAWAYQSGDGEHLHDSVCHSGKHKAYTREVTHLTKCGKELKAVAGTQSLDGWWSHGKRACHGVQARHPEHVEAHLRFEQWQHWTGNEDRWSAIGKVLSWVPE